MKVYVQIVDSRTGIHQSGLIDEPAKEGFEIANALEHFGVKHLSVEWNSNFINSDIINSPRLMVGSVTGTSKIVSVIAI